MEDMAQLNLIFFSLNILIIALIGAIMAIMPYITHKSLLFGVRIPEEARSLPEVRRMKHIFTAAVFGYTLAALAAAVAQYLLWPDLSLLTCLYMPVVMLLVQLAVYIPLWKKATALKREKGWILPAASLTDPHLARTRERFGGLPRIWYIGSLILTVLVLLGSLAVYPYVPDTLVTHWNAAMEADAWAAKSIGHLIAMPVISIVMILFMLGCNLAVYRMKLQVSKENLALSYAQHRVYRRLLSHMLGWITLCITLMFLGMQPMMLNFWAPGADFFIGFILIPTAAMVLPPVLLSLKAGQAGNKLHPAITEADVAAAGCPPPAGQTARPICDEDRCWKLGMFYFNPADPSWLVEDRFGSNGGLNFARPAARFLAVLLLALVLATYIGSTILFIQLF